MLLFSILTKYSLHIMQKKTSRRARILLMLLMFALDRLIMSVYCDHIRASRHYHSVN